MVYFIGNIEQKIVKIGVATNLKRRLSNLQIGNPYELIVLLKLEGGYTLEKEFHILFKQYRLCGEWFVLSDEILSYISTYSIDPEEYHIKKHIHKEGLHHKPIEELYKLGKSNIEIAKELDLDIGKVRHSITNNKLCAKYRTLKAPKKQTGYYNTSNKRKKIRKDYKKGIITEDIMNQLLLQHPVSNKGRKSFG